jgi:hypothetical protein
VLVTSDKTALDDQITALWISENNLNTNITKISQRVDSIENPGAGRDLTSYDFGVANPSQTVLTNYAISQIPSVTNPLDIWDGTRVVNTFNNILWKLVNTPNSPVPIFEWISIGNSTVASFTNTTAGTILGDNVQDGFIQSAAGGKGTVTGWANKATLQQVTQAIAAIIFPVTSVNGQTGNVNLTAAQVGATTLTEVTSAITNALAPLLVRLTELEARAQLIPVSSTAEAITASQANPNNFFTAPDGS